MKKVTCPECGKVVEEALRRGHGRLRVTKIERHTCPHGRLCIGASVHRRDPTGKDRQMYCEACATDHEQVGDEAMERAGLGVGRVSGYS